MGKTKKYWTGLAELDNTPEFVESSKNEFAEDLPVADFLSDDRLKESSTGRRDFLKFMGFSITAATLAACEAPVIKSIPYVNKPVDITPGVANYYASAYYDGNDFGSMLVKTREGRPIFLKGNKDYGFGGGVLNSRINSSVLGLYDSARLNGPKIGDADASWSDLDSQVKSGLGNGNVVVLSNTVISPSTSKAIDAFASKYGASHVMVDNYSYNGITSAHNESHGTAAVPQIDFSKAKTIVAVACDFLGTWLTSNLFAGQYAQTRKPGGDWMSKHHHFESCMSLTGSNADERTAIKPSEEGLVLAALYAEVTGGGASGIEEHVSAAVKSAAADLKNNRGESLVVSGSNDVNVQLIVNAINDALGNYGNSIDIENPISLYRGDDKAMESLIADMNAGKVGSLIVYGTNPSYFWHDTEAFNAGLAKVETSVCFNLFEDETSSRCKFKAPDHHYLESWNDLSIVEGRVDMVQPTISPLFNSRYAQESFLNWAGIEDDYYTYLRKTHNPSYSESMFSTDTDWNKAIHNGVMMTTATIAVVENVVDDAEIASETDAETVETSAPKGISVDSAIAAVKKTAQAGGTWQLVAYQKVGIGTGNQAANPWHQELPDPISKVTWDNYVTMAPSDIEELGLNRIIAQRDKASVVTVSANGKDVNVPVMPSPGQKKGTIGIAVGYGRGSNGENIGKTAYHCEESGEHVMVDGKPMPIGVNSFAMGTMNGSVPTYHNYDINITTTGEEYSLATTQMHSTIMGRDSIVKETTIAAYTAEKGKAKGTASWNTAPTLAVHEDVNGDGVINALDKKSTNDFDLWQTHPVEEVGHRWGMSIDLSTCTGCSACVTACHLENNVPVVGKDEVRRHRDMHWMRIDRFFSSEFATVEETSEGTGLGTIGAYGHMENPEENPQTVHMPMMCQHCNHAPCETVCPVAATTHSNEGLNMMAYNRCIGTRYCANNCAFKVRRFNWFNYPTYKKFKNIATTSQDELTRMVLNPDVVVRTRGVMEKCSMCIQRIQEGKLDAKVAKVAVSDGAINTACAESCPTDAISFGDLNDKASDVRGRMEDVRSYLALEEVGMKQNIYYMTKVRNNDYA